MTRDNTNIHSSSRAATLNFSRDPKLDNVLYLVTDQRRRCLLYVLEHVHSGGVEIEELAQAVVEVDENATSTERIRTDLVHHQLPRMAAAGVIEYDRESGRVEYVGSDLLEEILGWMQSRELREFTRRSGGVRRYR